MPLQLFVFLAIGSAAPFLSIFFKKVPVDQNGSRATYLNLYQFAAIIGSAIRLLLSPLIIQTWNSRTLKLANSLIFFIAAIYLLIIPLKYYKKSIDSGFFFRIIKKN